MAQAASHIALRDHMRESLAKLTVSDLDISRAPIVLDAATDPKKALEVLIENKVMAAPVCEAGRYIGVLDLRDTVKYALEIYSQGAIDKAKAKAMEYLAISPQITTNTLSYLARMRSFAMVKENDPVMNVVKLLAKGHHIVGVVSEDGTELRTILSQGMIFRTVCDRWQLEEQKDSDVTLEQLKELSIVTSPVISVPHNMKAQEAFAKMTKEGLSGLAVVDADGKIIHNTSATDIKLWLIASRSLEETIEQFLIEIRKLSLVERYPITMCSMTDGLSKAVSKLKATRYHRMWIVDGDTRPIGVMALTDIFKFVCLE